MKRIKSHLNPVMVVISNQLPASLKVGSDVMLTSLADTELKR